MVGSKVWKVGIWRTAVVDLCVHKVIFWHEGHRLPGWEVTTNLWNVFFNAITKIHIETKWSYLLVVYRPPPLQLPPRKHEKLFLWICTKFRYTLLCCDCITIFIHSCESIKHNIQGCSTVNKEITSMDCVNIMFYLLCIPVQAGEGVDHCPVWRHVIWR